ncbi:MAG: porin [Bradyrhizobium sp.]|uniref:porin n=1 Tax=Bradyrhizobium sp. TaxID=376 RepID=UPI001C28ECCE|nr:porin [Bradyrhizobium sp.]MBU6463273.1 porin [Pseudomonadota bacterium]MDE2066632.1 porin [Bradyrhizobium sp.]
MKMVRSLILGSAAGLVAMSGAQAADLPVKAKAVEYVRICSLYGAGFYYIPGTDTCIKLGGYLRVDLGVNTNGVFTGNTGGAGGAQNRFTDGFVWRSRGDETVDTRTATEYGVVRTFVDVYFQWTDDNYASSGFNGATQYGALSGTYAGSTPNNGVSGNVAAGEVGVAYAFIQFAGFTMGRAVSQFSAPWVNYPGNITDALVGGGGTITGVNQFNYTFQFGSGMSASIGVQDPTAFFQAGVNNLGVAGPWGYGSSDYGGTSVPDIVGQFRVDQAWGLFQASFAAHENNPAYYNNSNEALGGPDYKWGWAGQLALSIKNIPTGPGDTINVQGVYTDGATRYNIQDFAATAGSSAVFSGLTGVGFGFAPDSVFGPNGSQQLIQTWGMRGAFNHHWDPYWASSLFGAYASVHYNDAAKTLMCGPGGTVVTALHLTGTCNPDYSIAQLGANTSWTPVKNLTFTVEGLYTWLNQNYTGQATTAAAESVGKPGNIAYNLQDEGTWTVMFRAQRNW